MQEDNNIDSQVSMAAIVDIFGRRKKILAVVFAGIFMTVSTGTFLLPRLYRATAKVLVEMEQNSEKALLFRLNNWNVRPDYDRIATEIEIICNRSIAERVVDELHLDKLKLNRSGLSARAKKLQRDITIDQLLSQLKVSRSKNTNVLQVDYQDRNPDLAAQIVNAVVEKYTKYRSELFKDTRAYQFFDEQIKLTEEKLNKLEAIQAQFHQQQKVSEPEKQSLILLEKIGDFEQSLTAVKTRRIGKEARLKIMKEQLRNRGNDIIIPGLDSGNNPFREEYLANLKSKMADLEIERQSLLTRFTPSYYDVVKKNAEIDLVLEKINLEVQRIVREEETTVKALRAEEKEYELKITELNGQLQNLMVNRFEIEKLSRGVADNREVYSMLLKQREEARISQSKQDQVVQVKILNAAVVPFKSAYPNRPLLLVLGFFCASIISMGTAILVDSINRYIITIADAEKCLGLPVLATISDDDNHPGGANVFAAKTRSDPIRPGSPAGAGSRVKPIA